MMKTIFLFSIILLSCQESYGQIGIGTTTPDASSVLEVSSGDKGVLFPRLTIVQRDAIVNPAKGLTVYNLDEDCLQINSGSTSSPDWSCVGGSPSASVVNNCNVNGFEGDYVNGLALAASHKFSVTINNNSFDASTINFTTGDLVLSGVSGLSVSSVSPISAIIVSGGSQIIEYTLSGTPGSGGTLMGVWTKLGLNCTKTVNVVNGDATFTLPQTAIVLSINDGTPLVDIQGVVDNASNQLTVTIPYTSGVGTYDAYSGSYTANNAGTAEGGDANSFRLTYPGGTFSATGSITATIEVDGDGSFDAQRQLFGIQETIAALDFQVNGNSKGNVNLDVIGGISDRNFAEANHKFIYLPVTAADGNVWLNNNLGANYSNINHAQFSPTQQATARNDRHAYGSLFQWGRYSDGHELINYSSSTTGTGVNGTTSTNATSDTPENNLFITEGSSPFDWRVPQNNNLWQGESGINNPCPQGYRLPTDAEINDLISAEGITNNESAASSTLAFSALGRRNRSTGAVNYGGINGYYWTSSLNGTYARDRRFSSSTSTGSNRRGYGFGVRCLKHIATPSENVLTQIGNEADSPDAFNSVVTIAQLNSILPALTDVDPSKETAYQDYIDANPNLFSAPATQAEVQAMLTSFIPPAILPGNITLTAGQTQYIVSVYDEDYLPYTTPTGVATTGSAVAGGGNETLINVEGVLNTTTGLTVKIPYSVSSGSVSLPAFSQTRTVNSDHIQGANPLSNDGGGSPVVVELSYDVQPGLTSTGFITATIKAVSTDLNAVKLDINAGTGTDFGILMAEFSIAINDGGDTGPVYLKDITAAPDRNIADANHKFIYIPTMAADGNLWLNNNLGANYANLNHAAFSPNTQASAHNDLNAYGSLFQWGRYSDGHELINYSSSTTGTGVNGSTSTNATSDTPGNNLFITEGSSPYDWRVPKNDNLWQGEAGINNPCPQGYRLPTEAEMTALVSAEGITNYTTAASSSLAFPASGGRSNSNGTVYNEGSTGYYWASSVSGTLARSRNFFSSGTNTNSLYRASGFGVRCLKD